MCARGQDSSRRVRGPALFGSKGGFEDTGNVLSITAICCHGTEGYLGLRLLKIPYVLPRCSLYPACDMQLVHVSCLATDQPSLRASELSVKLWPSSTLLWRLTSAIRGLGESMTEETVSRYRGQGRPVLLLLSAS